MDHLWFHAGQIWAPQPLWHLAKFRYPPCKIQYNYDMHLLKCFMYLLEHLTIYRIHSIFLWILIKMDTLPPPPFRHVAKSQHPATFCQNQRCPPSWFWPNVPPKIPFQSSFSVKNSLSGIFFLLRKVTKWQFWLKNITFLTTPPQKSISFHS